MVILVVVMVVVVVAVMMIPVVMMVSGKAVAGVLMIMATFCEPPTLC